MNLRRTRAVFRKEWLHIVRDTRSLLAALAMPLLLLLLFGYALTLDVDRIPTLVYDQDRTPESRALIARFEGSRFFSILDSVDRYGIIEASIDRDEALLAVVVPAGYSKSLLNGETASVQLLLDGSDSNTAALAAGYAEGVVQTHAVELRAEAQNRRGLKPLTAPVEPRLRVWYNSDLKSRNYIVPGLIAVILMIIAALLTSLTIAREWETGTMEQLLSTPVRPAELVLGKLMAFFVLGIIDMLVSIFVGVIIFRVPLAGSAMLLFVSSCIFLFGALCWGIFISTLARNQLVAYQAGILSSFLPAFLLSGFIYAIENMPHVVQAITYLVPARYFVNILKGIFLKGVGVSVLWWELLLLLIYAAVLFLVATRRLRQKVA